MVDIKPKPPSPRSVSPTSDDDDKFRNSAGKGDIEPEPKTNKTDWPARRNVPGVTRNSDRERMCDEQELRRRDPRIQWNLEHSACTGYEWVDLNPTELATVVLEDIFLKREDENRRKGNTKEQKNFIT